MPRQILFPAKKSNRDQELPEETHYQNEVYQAFMIGYVKRINDATLRVPIGGVRIGSAKYSRLAQINLRTHIITFSRFAIEDVPERGRRYLVIHELAHVKEASHNRTFWQLVAAHEPKYKEIGKELQDAFSKNVRASERKKGKGVRQAKLFPTTAYDWESYSDSLSDLPDETFAEHEDGGTDDLESGVIIRVRDNGNPGLLYPLDTGTIRDPSLDYFDCNGGNFSNWDSDNSGIVSGGSEYSDDLGDDFFDHL